MAVALACLELAVAANPQTADAAEKQGLFVSYSAVRTAADQASAVDLTRLRSRFATIDWNMASAVDAGLQRRVPGARVRLNLNLFEDANISGGS